MKKIIFIFSFLCLLILPNLSLAEETKKPASLGGLETTAGQIGYKSVEAGAAESEINTKIGFFINTVLIFVGLIFVVLIWIGALDMVAANGDEKLYIKGKDRIKNGAIGILIIFLAYGFTQLVLQLVSSSKDFNI